MPSGPARYQSYPSHLQRTSVPPEAYTPSMDSNAGKEQSREGGKNRGGLPKHLQEQHMSKSEPKLSSPVPGGLYPGTYPPPSSRSQHLLPPQSETPPSRGESGTPSREKTQSKPMTIQEHELRVLGKITSLTFQRGSVALGASDTKIFGYQGQRSPQPSPFSLWPLWRLAVISSSKLDLTILG